MIFAQIASIGFAAFGATYMLLVFTSCLNQTAYTITGILLAVMTVVAFIMSEVNRKKEFTLNM